MIVGDVLGPFAEGEREKGKLDWLCILGESRLEVVVELS